MKKLLLILTIGSASYIQAQNINPTTSPKKIESGEEIDNKRIHPVVADSLDRSIIPVGTLMKTEEYQKKSQQKVKSEQNSK